MQKILNQKLVDAAIDQDDTDGEDGDTSLPSVASAASSSTSTPGPSSLKKKGRPKNMTNTPTPPTTVTTTIIHATPISHITPAITNSPKNRIVNNPLLKKKLLGLQKFLNEYTVKSKMFCTP